MYHDHKEILAQINAFTIVFVSEINTESYGVFPEQAENNLERMKQVFPNAKITRVNTGWIMEIPED